MHFIVAGNSSNTYACCSMRCLWCITWSLDCWYFSLQANYMWTIILSSLFAYLICVQEFLCFHMTIMLVWTVNVICLELGQVRNLALMQFVLIMYCLMKFGPNVFITTIHLENIYPVQSFFHQCFSLVHTVMTLALMSMTSSSTDTYSPYKC